MSRSVPLGRSNSKVYGQLTEEKFREVSAFFESAEHEDFFGDYPLPPLTQADELQDDAILERRRLPNLQQSFTSITGDDHELHPKELRKRKDKIASFFGLSLQEYGSFLEQFINGEVSFSEFLERSGFQVGRPDFEFTKAERRMIALMLLKRRKDYHADNMLKGDLPEAVTEMLSWDESEISAECIRFQRERAAPKTGLEKIMEAVEGNKVGTDFHSLSYSQMQGALESEMDPAKADAEIEKLLEEKRGTFQPFSEFPAHVQTMFEELKEGVAQLVEVEENPKTKQLLTELLAVQEKIMESKAEPVEIWRELCALSSAFPVSNDMELQLLSATEAYDVDSPEQLLMEFYPESYPDEDTWQRRRVIVLHKIYTLKALLEELERLDEEGTPYKLETVRKMQEEAEMEIRLHMAAVRKRFQHILGTEMDPELETEQFFKHLLVLKELSSAFHESLAMRREASKVLKEAPEPEEAVAELARDAGLQGEHSLSEKDIKELLLDNTLQFLGFDLSNEVIDELVPYDAALEVIKSLRQSIHLDRQTIADKLVAMLEKRGVPLSENFKRELYSAQDDEEDESDEEPPSFSDEEDEDDSEEDEEEEEEDEEEEYEELDNESDLEDEENDIDQDAEDRPFDLSAFLERRMQPEGEGNVPWQTGETTDDLRQAEDILIKEYVTSESRYLEAETEAILSRKDDPFAQLPFSSAGVKKVIREVDATEPEDTLTAEDELEDLIKAGGRPDEMKIPRTHFRSDRRIPTATPGWLVSTRPPPPAVRVRKVDDMGRAYGTGRRKNSVARVWVREGTGQVIVNKQPVLKVFPRDQHRQRLLEPLLATGQSGKFDIWCTVKGGGVSGQADAIKLGVARALQNFDPELRWPLKIQGMLRRDPRVVEEKKYGRKKARKSFQWVKR